MYKRQPLAYRDGFAFTWQYGRRLSSISHNGDSISYTYDPDGIDVYKRQQVTHGQALAAFYPAFTRYTYPAAIEKFATVGRILNSEFLSLIHI